MFLPSEAVYAELHAGFPDIVERAHRARVYTVSPTTLWATLNTIRAVLKDVRMREQAGVIQLEVAAMMEDVARLDDRTANLQKHFDLAVRDVQEVRVSAGKIVRHGERIAAVEMEEKEPAAAVEPSPVAPPVRRFGGE
jgi:DNA recombination protein RmuC